MEKARMIPENLVQYLSQEMKLDRVFALVELINNCNANNIKIKKITYYLNGFQVVFENIVGDAILHDGSYGNNHPVWETIGMPWDYDDVSVHDSNILTRMMRAMLDGKDWEAIEKEG